MPRKQQARQVDAAVAAREAAVRRASDALSACKTAEQVREVWRSAYLEIGHRTLGRLLLGRTAEQVLGSALDRIP